MTSPRWPEINGPLSPYAPGFGAELEHQGYKPLSLLHQIRLLGDLSRWLDEQGLAADALTPKAAERYLADRPSAGHTTHLTARALTPVLTYLRGHAAIAPAPVPAPHGAAEELLWRYRDYLERERGLVPMSARGYVDKLRPFVEGVFGPEGPGLANLTAAEVGAYLAERAATQGRRATQLTATALRSLLGYLYLEGEIDSPLADAVPAAASPRLAGLPKALEPAEVRALLESCDPAAPCGRRDLAILTILWRLGLRAGEVASLGLDDLDFRAGELVVRGKGRSERLPLPTDVGEALVSYLRDGRPATAQGRSVFVRVKAPHRGLTAGAVGYVVRAAAHRAGLEGIHAHRLRHTAASELLRAGASLPEVGRVLGHRRLATTAIYAKLDREALREIARPWPEELR